MPPTRVLVLGAAGRDFHDFATVLRDDPRYQVVGFTAADVRGRGLMMAVEYRQPVAGHVAHALAVAGLLAKDTRGTTIRLMPPLVIPDDVLDAALDAAIPVLDRAGVPPA